MTPELERDVYRHALETIAALDDGCEPTTEVQRATRAIAKFAKESLNIVNDLERFMT